MREREMHVAKVRFPNINLSFVKSTLPPNFKMCSPSPWKVPYKHAAIECYILLNNKIHLSVDLEFPFPSQIPFWFDPRMPPVDLRSRGGRFGFQWEPQLQISPNHHFEHMQFCSYQQISKIKYISNISISLWAHAILLISTNI